MDVYSVNGRRPRLTVDQLGNLSLVKVDNENLSLVDLDNENLSLVDVDGQHLLIWTP